MKGVLVKFLSLSILAVGLLSGSTVLAADYTIDQAHSTLGFSVAHLVITKTKGSFGEYEGMVSYDPEDAAAFKADVTIQAASIDTKNQKRDDHLRNPDFFNVEEYPTITFTSTQLVEGEDGWVIVGDLTMLETTNTIEIPVEISGPVDNPFSEGQILGLEGEVVIDRKDWGITWNKSMDTGGVVVGEDVTLQINLELHSAE